MTNQHTKYPFGNKSLIQPIMTILVILVLLSLACSLPGKVVSTSDNTSNTEATSDTSSNLVPSAVETEPEIQSTNPDTQPTETSVAESNLLPERWLKAELTSVEYTEVLPAIPELNVTQGGTSKNGWQYVIVSLVLENLTDKYVITGSNTGELDEVFGDDHGRFWPGWDQGLYDKASLDVTLISKEENVYPLTLPSRPEKAIIIPPKYRVKIVTLFEVPKNQTGLQILLKGLQVTPEQLSLDGPIDMNVQLPTDPDNTTGHLKIGDTWEVEKLFRITFNGLTREPPSELKCGDNTLRSIQWEYDFKETDTYYLNTSVENLSGNDLDGIYPGLVFSDHGQAFPGIRACFLPSTNPYAYSGDSPYSVLPVPPGEKQEVYFYFTVPKNTGNLHLMLGKLIGNSIDIMQFPKKINQNWKNILVDLSGSQ